MRYKDLFDARAWRKYAGRDRRCRLISSAADSGHPEEIEAPVQYGTVSTGRSRVFAGWFCSVGLPTGEMIIEEDPHNLRAALRQLAERLASLDLVLDAVGLDDAWQESGLSSNTGWGYHPNYEGAVHMFETAELHR